MERYQFSQQEQAIWEGLKQPFAIYQFVDKRVVTLTLSDGFCELFGYTDREQAYYDMDHDMYKDTHPDDAPRIANEAVRFATQGGDYEVIYRSRIPGTDEYRVIHAFGRHVNTAEGIRLAHVWYTDEGPCTTDLSVTGNGLNKLLDNTLHRENIIKSGNYDFLTGLPGMTYFFELAVNSKETFIREGLEPVMLYIDLNGMKYFNRRFGFAEGNKLIAAYGRLLASIFGNECCCHIAGDHFAAFAEAKGLEEKLESFFREAKELNGGNSLSMRVGIYSNKVEDVPADTACDRAKFACDSIRQHVTSEFSYYDQKQKEDLDRRQYILTHFTEAMERRHIQVYYQPIVRGVNGRVCDEEALARWIDPEKGFLSPADFIPHLEEAGLIWKLDLYVLDRILEKFDIMKKAELHLVPQSLNLSRSDFDACDIVEEIRSRVDAAGIERRLITVEITESMIGKNMEFMKRQVERFRELGFPVWMDDFGSGYSSLNVLQDIKFDLIKFDMVFMTRLDEGDGGKIILTEMMKMATSLGLDTVCEGVETEAQVNFLREIGCSKLQGFFFLKPVPLGQILERYEQGKQIGFENPEESEYYASIGRMSLYDLSMVASETEETDIDNSIPMGIVQIGNGKASFIRMNQAYKQFMTRHMGMKSDQIAAGRIELPDAFAEGFAKKISSSLADGNRAFVDDYTPDGAGVHSMLKKIGINPVTGMTAVAVAILSVRDPEEGATYASIARTLASDYFNLYYVDLETDDFIEYTSPVGGEEMTVQRHGTDFFHSALKDSETRIYKRDLDLFQKSFQKENILKVMDREGSYKISYRLMDSGEPVYAGMKIMRMQNDKRHIIIGVGLLDTSMRESEAASAVWKDMDTYARIMALAGDYISIYMIDPATGHYTEFSATNEYQSIGLPTSGEDFFAQSLINVKAYVYPDDQPMFDKLFTRENLMYEVRKNGMFTMHYRLMIDGKPKKVSLKIALVRESDGEKLIAGVRAWRERS